MTAKVLSIVRCSRFAGSQLCRPRRVFLLLILSSLITISWIFYGRVQEQLALCQNKDQWQCSLEALQYSEDEEPMAEVPIPDSSPLVKTPEPSKSWLPGVESLEDVYGVVSDAIKKPGVLAEWKYERDANDTSMSRRQCQLAFPEIYKEIVRTQEQYSKFHIVEEDLDLVSMLDGRVRTGVYNGKLYILKTSLTAETRPKALGVLQSINAAISNPGPNSIPNIEFIFSVNRKVRGVASPIWVFDREEENDKVWLMPSTGFVWEGAEPPTSAKSVRAINAKAGEKEPRRAGSKEEEKVTKFKPVGPKQGMIGVPRDQLVAEVETMEGSMSFGNKTQRLIGVWRNTTLAQNARHKALSRAANGHSWAENDKTITTEFALQGLDALNMTTSKGLVMGPTSQLSLSQMCRFAFLGHDSSFAIPVADGPLLCASVLLTTKPKWIELYHSLMRANQGRFDMGDENHPVVQAWGVKGAGEQNTVLMADDFGDLNFKMEGLMKYPDVAEAIANNSRKTFRERYLTKAATACYWRELMRGYSAVSYKPGAWKEVVKRDGGGDPAEVRRSSRRGIRWESFLMLDDDSQMAFDEDEFGELFNDDEEGLDYLL